MVMCLCRSICMRVGAHGGQKRTSDPLQAIVSIQMWMMQTELKFSGKEIVPLYC